LSIYYSIWRWERRLTVTWLRAFATCVTLLITVTADYLALVRTVLREVSFLTTVAAGTSTTTLRTILGEVTN
jgi:hypothetical protein